MALLWRVAVGAAFGTSKAGIGIAGLGGFRPELIMKVRLSSHTRNENVHVADLCSTVLVVSYTCGYVGYYRRVWLGRVGSDIREWYVYIYPCYPFLQSTPVNYSEIERLHISSWVHSSRGRACVWDNRSSSWLRDWNRWRFGISISLFSCVIVTESLTVRAGLCSRVKSLRVHGAHSYFCGGAGSLRVRLYLLCAHELGLT